MKDVNGPADVETIASEIADLEERLAHAKIKLKEAERKETAEVQSGSLISHDGIGTPSHHFLLLLSDSALPLGSFAFSSGLESYLAHTRPSSSFSSFLRLSLASYSSTTLPFVLAAHRNPEDLLNLDDIFDATIMCTVGRRASVAQGRALLSIWDRSFNSSLPRAVSTLVIDQLKGVAVGLRSISSSGIGVGSIPAASAHLAPLFGAVASILGLTLRQTAYVFMLSHVKALLSAAVRASIFGPYQAQKVLASHEVQAVLTQTIDAKWHTEVEDAGQTVPIMDLWIGRHEMLYSRIFNS